MFWSSIYPLVCLAPMEGYTDLAFRQMIRKFSKNIVLFTEFVSVDGLFHNPEVVEKKLKVLDLEQPVVVQLFGNDPENFINAIEILKKYPISGLDINMGCPAHRVVKCQFGAALIKNADLAWNLAEICVKKSPWPISVKTRLGWDKKDQILNFAKGFAQVGISAISVHGRTYKQGFKGEADWDPIYELKRQLPEMTVIGNGDIVNSEQALAKIKNLDGLMVGRGIIGQPWFLEDIRQSLLLQKMVYSEYSLNDRLKFLLENYKLVVAEKGERRGIIEMRKQVGGYLRGGSGAKQLRLGLMQCEILEEVEIFISEFLSKIS